MSGDIRACHSGTARCRATPWNDNRYVTVVLRAAPILIVFFQAYAALSQETGPSKEETLRFIQERTAACPISSKRTIDFVYALDTYKASVSISGGALTTHEIVTSQLTSAMPHNQGASIGQVVSEATTNAPLSNLQAAVPVRESDITLFCYTGDCFSGSQVVSSMSPNNSVARFAFFGPDASQNGRFDSIQMCNNDDATRVAHAFEHLILLWGGKKPLF